MAAITHTNGSASRRYLAKFNAGSSADLTFPQISGNGAVYAIEKAPDGKIYVAGGFGSVTFSDGSVTSKKIVRINANGSHDATFDPGVGPIGNVKLIRPLANGQLYIAGDFTTYGGTTRTKLAVIEADGALNTDFDPLTGFNAYPQEMRVDSSGRIWCVGGFTTLKKQED